MQGELPDTFTARGANQLALKIAMFWSGLGLQGVKAWIEPLRTKDEQGAQQLLFQVRSNVTKLLCRS